MDMEPSGLSRLVPFLLIILLCQQTSFAEELEGGGDGGAISRDSIDKLLPQDGELFNKEAVDEDALSQMDCHLRNVDYCYAGILGTAQKSLPETDSDLEMRCDEMRAASSCMAIYNDRCASSRVMAALMPMSQSMNVMRPSVNQTPAELSELRLPAELLSSGKDGRPSNSTPADFRFTDLLSLCDPSQKGTKRNRLLRDRLFSVGRCINGRLPEMRPCVEDLKTALQLVFEPQRSLPLKPSCCAIARFRSCASQALDSFCGISSFQKLEAMMSSVTNKMLGTSVMERVCKHAINKDTTPCEQLLPPTGLRAPNRRGRKASKLAKALDLMTF